MGLFDWLFGGDVECDDTPAKGVRVEKVGRVWWSEETDNGRNHGHSEEWLPRREAERVRRAHKQDGRAATVEWSDD